MPATPTRDDVLAVLHGVVDPELGSNVVDLGMVQDIQIDEGGRVRVWVTLTISGCPLRTQIREDVESKIRGLPGVTDVAVEFGEMTPDQRTELMQRVRRKAADNPPPTEVPLSTRVIAALWPEATAARIRKRGSVTSARDE